MIERIQLSLRVLSAVASGTQQPSDIAARAAVPADVVERAIGDLERSGNLRRMPDGSLALGGRVACALTDITLTQAVVEAASEAAAELARDLDARLTIWVRDGFLARRVAEVRPSSDRVDALKGVPATPMHECAAGIALLAAAGSGDIDRYFALADTDEDWSASRALVERCARDGWVEFPLGDRTVDAATAIPRGASAARVAISARTARGERTAAVGSRLRAASATLARA